MRAQSFTKSWRAGDAIEAVALELRIEEAIGRALGMLDEGRGSRRLDEAIRYAVEGGGRVRPRLCLLAAKALGDREPRLAEAAAAAIELLHSASLVHDDLPAFDDARERRGRPTVHRAFGEPMALLAGDALIVLAFEALSRAESADPARALEVIRAVARGVGPQDGIVSGQALELEGTDDFSAVHRAKTGALFEAALRAGAAAAGGDADAWGELGARLGLVYQIADDLADALADRGGAALGKDARQDARNGRMSAVHTLGVTAARRLFDVELERALAAIPEGPWRATFDEEISAAARRLLGLTEGSAARESASVATSIAG